MIEAISSAMIDVAISKVADLILDKFIALPATETVPATPRGVPIIFAANPDIVSKNIRSHCESIRHWSREIGFTGIHSRKLVSKVFVELDLYLTPRNQTIANHDTSTNLGKTEPLIAAITNRAEHCVILGQAGAGKTTSLQKLCSDYIKSGKFLLNYNFPLLIRLRDLKNTNSDRTVISELKTILGVRTIVAKDVHGTWPRDAIESASRLALASFLDELNVAILLDGFDEILDKEIRETVLEEISFLTSALTKARLIVTSRSADFPYALQNTTKLELASLTIEQINAFAVRWFDSKIKAEDFLQKISTSPYADTTIRPLTIAHLCAVYERTGDIPDKPKSVYRRIVNLLLEDWDAQRSMKRLSKYAGLDTDRKLEFLAEFAYLLTSKYRRIRFDSQILREVYSDLCVQYNLPIGQAQAVAKEIESHSGLILETGNRVYEFAHKSLQEFLTAEHIVRLPSLEAARDYFPILPNELAIAISLSSQPTHYFIDLILRTLDHRALDREFYSTLCVRLDMEKVDIMTTPLSQTAACLVLQRINPPLGPMSTFRRIFLNDNLHEIAKHYRFQVDSDLKKIDFRKHTDIHPYSLPHIIRIDSDVAKHVGIVMPPRHIA